jgi:hypothetical protein
MRAGRLVQPFGPAPLRTTVDQNDDAPTQPRPFGRDASERIAIEPKSESTMSAPCVYLAGGKSANLPSDLGVVRESQGSCSTRCTPNVYV